MKTPFRFQASEYDCVPTTLINALSALFSRDEIPPIVIEKIYSYSLDNIINNNMCQGTTKDAIKMIGNWLDAFKDGTFSVRSEYFTGDKVNLKPKSKILKTLNEGGVALLFVCMKNNYWHYVLAVNSEGDFIKCFDPYLLTKISNEEDLEFIEQNNIQIQSPNLKIHINRLDSESKRKKYAFGKMNERTCLLLSRDSLDA